MSIFLWVSWYSLRSRRKLAGTEEQQVDVSQIIDAINEQESSDPKLRELLDPKPIESALPLVPRFHSYVKDRIDGLAWEWAWKSDADEPRPEYVERLHSRCPVCDLRIVPAQGSNPRTVFYGDKPKSLANLPRRSYTANDPFCSFACEKNHFQAIVRLTNLESEYSRIKNLIEQKARQLMEE
jgi:hypothetical protein